MNKSIIGQRIRSDREKIIKMYNEDIYVSIIAEEYNVVESTIYMYLRKWDVPFKRNVRQKKKVKRFKRKFSPEFLAHQAECQRLCGDKVKYISGYSNTTEDQRLITNIICRPIIG